MRKKQLSRSGLGEVSGKAEKPRGKGFLGTMFSDMLEVPEEIALDLPKITLLGNLHLDIENHKGIISYSGTEVRLRVNNGFLVAVGKNLALKNISQEDVALEGEILQLAILLEENADEDIYDLADLLSLENLEKSQLVAAEKANSQLDLGEKFEDS